jgi:hypothetical protein
MPGILIRDVPEATVAEIDQRAGNLGVSRNECLRRWLDTEMRAAQPVTPEDLRRVSGVWLTRKVEKS